jgi:hypothetical protein
MASNGQIVVNDEMERKFCSSMSKYYRTVSVKESTRIPEPQTGLPIFCSDSNPSPPEHKAGLPTSEK